MHLVLFLIGGVLLTLMATALVRLDLAQFLLHGVRPKVDVTKLASPSHTTRQRNTVVVESAKAEPAQSTFDVVRIDPGGVSVFAGQAPPNSKVTILVNGQAVAIAQADPTGAWVAVTERDFPPADYELSLHAMSADHADSSASPSLRLTVRGLQPPKEVASSDPALASSSVPTPITFEYNETTLTLQGRKAAALLAQYLIARRSQSAFLSGHADERGSDLYNFQLSRDRLQVVADYLRGQGFSGQLDLQAKGKSEPYAGVDRRALSREQGFQLDRRVELRAAN